MTKTKDPVIGPIIVCGGGLAGLTMTALLGSYDIPVLCLDRENIKKSLSADFDGRTTAISYGSHLVMKEAGIWPYIENDCAAIRDIYIKDGAQPQSTLSEQSPVLLRMLAQEANKDAFGWVVENKILRQALYKRISALPCATLVPDTIVTDFVTTDSCISVTTHEGKKYHSPLVIGADGRQSAVRHYLNIPTRGWHYKQTACVCIIHHEKPHEGRAVEHFYPEGPLAIVPMVDGPDGVHRSTLIWTQHPNAIHALQESDDDLFLTAINARLPSFYGRITHAGKRFFYPLSLQHAESYIGPRMALIAEAAHAMHPIAGQGLNLSLRDIAALGALLRDAAANTIDAGTPEILERYQKQRRFDTTAMMAVVDGINALFSTNFPPAVFARHMGLKLFNRTPRLKKALLRQAMGIAGLVPDVMKVSSK